MQEIRHLLMLVGIYVLKLFIGSALAMSMLDRNVLPCFVMKEGAYIHAAIIGLVQIRFLVSLVYTFAKMVNSCRAWVQRRRISSENMKKLIEKASRIYCNCEDFGHHRHVDLEVNQEGKAILPIAPFGRHEDAPKVCSICLDELKDGDHILALPKCLHVFHKRCLQPWLNKHNSCPNCRKRAV